MILIIFRRKSILQPWHHGLSFTIWPLFAPRGPLLFFPSGHLAPNATARPSQFNIQITTTLTITIFNSNDCIATSFTVLPAVCLALFWELYPSQLISPSQVPHEVGSVVAAAGERSKPQHRQGDYFPWSHTTRVSTIPSFCFWTLLSFYLKALPCVPLPNEALRTPVWMAPTWRRSSAPFLLRPRPTSCRLS